MAPWSLTNEFNYAFSGGSVLLKEVAQFFRFGGSVRPKSPLENPRFWVLVSRTILGNGGRPTWMTADCLCVLAGGIKIPKRKHNILLSIYTSRMVE